MAGKLNSRTWVADDNTERDGFGTDDGLIVGDLCHNLSPFAVDVCLTAAAAASTWEPGPVALAGGFEYPGAIATGGGAIANGAGGANDAVFGGGVGSTGVTIFSGIAGTSSVVFTDVSSAVRGRVDYTHSNDRMNFATAGVGVLTLFSGALFPSAGDTMDLGGGGNRYDIVFARTGNFSLGLGIHGATPPAQAADPGVLTDSTGGTPNNTLVAISGSGDDAAINDNFADLIDQVNQLRAMLSEAAGGVGISA